MKSPIPWSLAPGVFASQDPVVGVSAHKLLGPTAAHWFGTDHLGRDLYTRVVYGTVSSVTSALIAHAASHGGMMLAAFAYPWIAIYAAHFFPRRAVNFQAVLITAGIYWAAMFPLWFFSDRYFLVLVPAAALLLALAPLPETLPTQVGAFAIDSQTT